MIANVIERQFKRANDWPFGAALSFLLMYLTFIAIAIQALVQRRGERSAPMSIAEPVGMVETTRRRSKDKPGPLEDCAAGRFRPSSARRCLPLRAARSR